MLTELHYFAVGSEGHDLKCRNQGMFPWKSWAYGSLFFSCFVVGSKGCDLKCRNYCMLPWKSLAYGSLVLQLMSEWDSKSMSLLPRVATWLLAGLGQAILALGLIGFCLANKLVHAQPNLSGVGFGNCMPDCLKNLAFSCWVWHHARLWIA